MKQWYYNYYYIVISVNSIVLLLLHQHQAVISFTTKVNINNHNKHISSTISTSATFVSSNNQDNIIIEKEKQLQDQFYEENFNFPLDDWQIKAGNEIYKQNNVIVCAPTGSGKTVVGEISLHLALDENDTNKAIYTTPLKALSNQKYIELRAIFGKNNVGLSTGDMSINRNARIIIMTTEVYRNMCWRRASSANDEYDDLDDVSTVIFDEFHYMGQPGRGSVWEESVIMSPYHTKLVCLSATLPNANDLSKWIQSVTTRNTILIEATTARPVPLLFNYAFKGGKGNSGGIVPLFCNENAGPGSPFGLLGLRGDGIPEQNDIEIKKKNKKKKKKFIDDNNNDDKESNINYNYLPKGLHINPIILASTRKQTEKVNRIIQRKLKEQQEQQYGLTTSPTQRKKSNSYMSRYEKKERNRLLKLEMRRNVPSLSSVVNQLNKKKLLPAIVFIFSRVGCEDACKNVCEDMFTIRTPKPVNDNNKETKKRKQQRYDLENIENEDYNNNKNKKTGGSRSRAYKKAKAAITEKKEKEQLSSTSSSSSSLLLEDNDGRIFRNNLDTMDFLFESSKQKNVVNDDYIDILQDDLQSIFDTTSTTTSNTNDDNNQILYNNDKLQLYAKYGLCNLPEVIETFTRIQNFNEANPEIAIPTDTTTKHWLLGVAAHHAGILPAHKLLIETLYKEQLIKIVFATETLSAGINMPARTTVITSIAKFTNAINTPNANNNKNNGAAANGFYGSSYTSSTHSLIPTSNFLQMAGRAGRRGMDTQGTCVIVASSFEGPGDAASILTKELEPIISQFTPSYSLVINLIARGGNGKLDFAKELISNSFSMWQKKKNKEEDEEDESSSSDLSLNGIIDGSSIDNMNDDPLVNFMNDDSNNDNKIDLDVLESIANERFIMNLVNFFQQVVEVSDKNDNGDDKDVIKDIIITLTDKPTLKKAMKSYAASAKILQLECNTLSYLERELQEMNDVQNDVNKFLSSSISTKSIPKENNDDDEQSWVEDDIETQQRRVKKGEEDLNDHIFTKTSFLINNLLQNYNNNEDDNMNQIKSLVQSLLVARSFQKDDNTKNSNNDNLSRIQQVTSVEILSYSKTSYILSKKQRKKYSRLLKINSIDNANNHEQENSDDNYDDDVDSTWQDTLSLVKTLEAYGCLQKQEQQQDHTTVTSDDNDDDDNNINDIIIMNNTKYDITTAGSDVALLGFENSLWALVAMSGTWDVNYNSKELDIIRDSFNDIFDDGYDINGNHDNNNIDSNPHIEEAETHLSNLLSLTPSELAGYVSILVAEEQRRGGSDNLIIHLDRLTKSQQRIIQSYMLSAERFMEVQKKFNVNESFFSVVDKMELSFCHVVTAWASGDYSWNEVVELSGMSAGDLVRILHRSLDALRQFANLPYHPIRKDNVISVGNTGGGIHPEIRNKCKEASSIMNRYPLKDPLPFDDEEEIEEFDDDDDDDYDYDFDDSLVGDSDNDEADENLLEIS